MKFGEFIGEMTVKINGMRAKPIKKKYMGRKLARGMDMRNMGTYFAENPDGGWEEIPSSLIEGDALDRLDSKMGGLNKKLSMLVKAIESAGFKVTDAVEGGMESDPGLDLEGGYDIQVVKANMLVLSHYDGKYVKEIARGPLQKIIAALKKGK